MPPKKSIQLRLSEVRLERFKAAFKPDRGIEFHPFNVIIGRNGAGKSTVLEAIQWVDWALRYNIAKATERYKSIRDLINHRTKTRPRSFHLDFRWDVIDSDDGPLFSRGSAHIEYGLSIGERRDPSGIYAPFILSESLNLVEDGVRRQLVRTSEGVRFFVNQPKELEPFRYPDDLILRSAIARSESGDYGGYLGALREFWDNAVFLRLSPNEMSQPTSSTQLANDPILGETGKTLPVLLRRFNSAERQELVRALQNVLEGFTDIRVGRPIFPQGEIHYSLMELMPHPGRKREKSVEIPVWMLSEGTRRIMAILAVIRSAPLPSILCIEEIENGLDPWSVVAIVNELISASKRGVQIAVTTHSPWLLDHVSREDILLVHRKGGDTAYERFADLNAVKAYKDRIPPGSIYASEG